MQGFHMEPIIWKCSGRTYTGKQTKFLHMPHEIIVLWQKMLERSYSYRLPSGMKYFSNSLQTSSALKMDCWSGEGPQGRGQWSLVATKMQPIDCPWEARSCIPPDTGLRVHPCYVLVWHCEHFPLINVQFSWALRLFWILKWTADKKMGSKYQGHEKQRKTEELFQMKKTKETW